MFERRKAAALQSFVIVFWCAVFVATPSAILAQGITGLSITKNPANSADDSHTGDNIIDYVHTQRRSTVSTLSSSSSAFQTKYAFVNGADSDAFFTGASSSLTADYKINFTVTVGGAYDLLVTTSRNLGFALENDAGGSGGATASMSAVTGSQSGGSLSGTLGFGAPATLSGTGGGSSNLDTTNPVATISGVSGGVGVPHQLNFSWTMSCNSQNSGINSGDACGQRGGLAATVPQLNSVGGYPGAPTRTAANDGHIVSVTLVSYCGNGVVEPGKGETCDEGAANGQPGSCCTSTCTVEAPTTVCRASSAGEVCDEVEFCTGSSGSCPVDVVNSGAVCRGASGDCDAEETCNGIDKTCPADDVLASGTECRAVDGDCDVAETCDGVGKLCPSDGFKSGGVECRAATTVCDAAEVCTGSSADCPPDAFAPSSTVCRATSVGEVCDVPETCSGVDDVCPPDGVASSATECRAATDVCDTAENCDGVGKTCPADAVASSATVCRAASVGEDCDAVENCDGVGKACPADEVLAAGTECRGVAGVCDVAEECDGAGKTCPSDAKSAAECRPSVGVCDVAENCDGVTNDCPADLSEPNGTSCEDGAFCNGTQTCSSGVCGGGGSPCGLGESCDEASDQCFLGYCPTNAVACRGAGKSKLLIKNKSDDGKDKVLFKWLKGEATTQGDFGDPTTTADYALCLYAGTTSALIEQAAVPAGANWSPISTKGYKYKDPGGSADGVTRIILKGGADGKAKAIVKGKGTNLPDFDGDLPIAPGDLPLVAQLRNNGNGECWEGAYLTPKRNQADQFNAKTP